MSAINSSTLFHFTRKFANFKRIIQKGLRFSYSFETFSNKEVILNEILPASMNFSKDIKIGDDSKEYGVAIPMVCFCDIPLMRTIEHKHKFGNYAIGFDKDFLSDLYNPILNPVLYMNSNNVSDSVLHFSKMSKEANNEKWKSIVEYCNNPTFQAEFEKDGDNAIINNKQLIEQQRGLIDNTFYAKTMLGYCKPYDYKNSKDKYICNYDEREWRAIIHDRVDDRTDWVWDVYKDDFKSNRKMWNKGIETCEDGFITILEGFQYHAITHIIVKTDEEIRPIIQLIMKYRFLFGENNISYEERLILVSKVTSFERIEKDY
jgi:hypothetical protein